jgi:hypothetical protein
MLTTNPKGLIAETAVIGECVRLGIGVCRPLDDERYDLILDLRPASFAPRPNGVITRRYPPDEIDCLAAHCAELGRSFLLPAETCRVREVRLRLGPTKNNQASGVRWATAYELAARLG